jgi:hypothetical protein
MEFLYRDHTNRNFSSDKYNCVNYSLDLVANALAENIDSWVVAVIFPTPPGHTFVAFPTTDSGIVWVEPQSDQFYLKAEMGGYLCYADNSGCWAEIVSRIIQPAICSPDTHTCK